MIPYKSDEAESWAITTAADTDTIIAANNRATTGPQLGRERMAHGQDFSILEIPFECWLTRDNVTNSQKRDPPHIPKEV
jgi:hypothetical protein